MNIIAKIGSAIRAFLRKTHQWIKVGGRWIMQSIPGGAEEVAMSAEPATQASAPDADLGAVKAVAATMAAGMDPAPEDLAKISDKQMQWLQAMDTPMLCRIACADVDQIRAHVRGKATIKGVLHADPAAVEAYLAAKAGIVPTGRKSLRQELAERGIHP